MGNFKVMFTNFQYMQNGVTKRIKVLVPVCKESSVPANKALTDGFDFYSFLSYYSTPAFTPAYIIPQTLETETKALASASGVPGTINYSSLFADGTKIIVDAHRTIEITGNTAYYKYDGELIFSYNTTFLQYGYSRAAFGLLYADYMTFPWLFNHTQLLTLVYEAVGSGDGASFQRGGASSWTITPILSGTHTAEDWFNGFTGSDPDPNAYRPGNAKPGGGKGTRPDPPGKFQPGGDAVPSRFADDAAINSGFMTVFTPTLAQINSLASYLWNEQPSNLDKIKKLFADPMDVIIGCHVLPINVSNVGSKEIMPGGLASGVTANYTNKQYYTKDMGSITVAEYWGSCLDYAPYTRINIFLPFIGTRTLDTDMVMGHTLHLYYTIEVTTGALLAQIEIEGNVVYEFSGNCAMSIPVSASDYHSAMQAAIGLAATIGAGIASGGAAAAPVATAAGVTEGAASAGITAATVASIGAATANAVLNSKPTIERTGSLGGAAGFMGVQKPYLIIEYPDQCLPENYMKYNGYPAYMTKQLSTVEGYTQCETVRFKSARATDEERKEIIQFLQSGVILGGDRPTKPTAISAGIGLTGYQCGSEDLVVNKSLTLALATQTVYLKKDTEIMRPTIILSADTINFNYAYIDAFDRFYYVTGVRNIGADRWEVDLRVDSLTSFSSDIDNATAVISRQENDWNLYIDDGTFKVYQNRNIYIYNFTGEFTDHSYILLVAGS